MDESNDNLFKNREVLIKTIRLIGVVFLLIGGALFFLNNIIISAVIFMGIGIFQITSAPRVLEWIIQVRNRDIKKDDI